MRRIVGSAVALVAIVVAACSSTSTTNGVAPKCAPPSGCPNPDPATTDLTTPVSFAKDVVPTFQKSCSLSTSCHQQKAGGPSQLYLGGPASAAPDPAGIIAATVGVPSVELPSMQYVKAGDPENSFIMRKLDGELCDLPAACADMATAPAANCGTIMPQGGCSLPGTTRDPIRRWIAQGAMNN